MKRFHSCRQTGVATPRGSRLRRDAEICTHFTDNSAALQPLLPRRNSVKVERKGGGGDRGREKRGEKIGAVERETETETEGEREREKRNWRKKRKERKKERKERTSNSRCIMHRLAGAAIHPFRSFCSCNPSK